MPTLAPSPQRPIVPWLGGKWRIAPWVISHFPEHVCYAEPFGGAASVLLRKPPSCNEIYNDLDGRLVNLFRVLQTPESLRELAAQLKRTPYARREFELAADPSADSIEDARKFLVRCHMGFRSIGAQKSHAGFDSFPRDEHSPAAAFRSVQSHLESIGNRLRHVIIENLDALDFVSRCDSPDALIYADPPYAWCARPASGGDGSPDAAYAHELDDDGHAVLARALHDTQAMVIISGFDCDLYRDLYAGWAKYLRHTTMFNNNSRIECLWLNPACTRRLAEERQMALTFAEANQ